MRFTVRSVFTTAVLGFGVLLFLLPAHAAAPGKPLPPLAATGWLNSAPLTPADLAGRVVLVEFWTRDCWNCHRIEPHLKAWHARYKDRGLAIVGVHTPESLRERDAGSVADYVRRNAIAYPVALDHDADIWESYKNMYWPTVYLADRRGVLRAVFIGDNRAAETEAAIERLLAEPH